MLYNYLLANHKDDLVAILEDEDDSKHFSINIKLDRLLQEDSVIANKLLKDFESVATKCKESVILAQAAIADESDTRNFIVKNNIHVRLYNFPPCPELVKTTLPTNQDVGMFLEISGTIIRATVAKLLEYKRNYKCTKCKQLVQVKADFEQRYLISPPIKCLNSECNGNKFIAASIIDRTNSKDYQEVKIQEQVSQSTIGLIPDSLWVILEDDLVDLCKPGDNVAICGIVKQRWKLSGIGRKIEVEVVIKANHVFVNNDISSITNITPEIKEYFSLFWRKYRADPLKGRDTIVKSFCAELYGLYLVKLALMVTLAGGSQFKDVNDTKIKTRSEPHLLLVGDPGTGKSQLLKFASRVIPRSVFTTGIGSTSAGLTVTAVNENGEWQLEAGALVLSDGGVCCIDEFNSMKEHDRTSIHEAMEQQTLSVAKASIVCKLNTRCSILAATNPKGNLDSSQNFNTNIGMASPLLSRFDLVFILKDSMDANWDSLVADFILNDFVEDANHEISWDLQMLQAYIIFIKKIHPILTNDTNKILSAYYQLQRKAITRNRARTTVRLLDSLVRLSQAHARLMCHTEVEIIDSITAVMLIEASMQGEASILGLEFDVYASNPENPTESYLQLIRSILTKLELFDLLEKEIRNVEEKVNQPQLTGENKEFDETLFQNSFKNVLRRHNSTVKNIVFSKRKSSDNNSDKSKKIKLSSAEKGEKTTQSNESQICESGQSESEQDNEYISSSNNSGNPRGISQSNSEGSSKTNYFYNSNNMNKRSCTLFNDDVDVDTDDIFEIDELVPNKENTSTQTNPSENKLEINASQKTRTKRLLNKFRFKPRDLDQNNQTTMFAKEYVEQLENVQANEKKQQVKQVEDVQESAEDTNPPVCDDESENKKYSDTLDDNLTQNTKNRMFINNFCFQPKAQITEAKHFTKAIHNSQLTQLSGIQSQSIFEQEEDCENLDLDL